MTTLGCLALYVLGSIVAACFWTRFLAIGPLADRMMEESERE